MFIETPASGRRSRQPPCVTINRRTASMNRCDHLVGILVRVSSRPLLSSAAATRDLRLRRILSHRRPRLRAASQSSHQPAHAAPSAVEPVIVLDGPHAYVEQPPAPIAPPTPLLDTDTSNGIDLTKSGDQRPVIDLTLGVLLSEPADFNILGFVALPRWLAGEKPFRFTSTSTRP